jgi:hypothetical protein
MTRPGCARPLTERGFEKARNRSKRQWQGIRLRGPMEPVTDVTDGDGGDASPRKLSTNARSEEGFKNKRHHPSYASSEALEDVPGWVTEASE